MDKGEAGLMHPKGLHLLEVAKEASETKNLTFINDIKKAPALVTDMIIDQILLSYLVIKIFSVVSPASFSGLENIYGACAIICLWTNTFLKFQITRKIGPFVIFMKYVPTDLYTVCTMFVTLFAPAFLVFYKTIFIKRGLDPDFGEDSTEGESDLVSLDTLDRVR